MKYFILLSLLAVCHAGSVFEDWVNFKETHGKKYRNPSEEQYRMGVFLRNKHMIEEHNKNYKSGDVSFHMKMNHFGDLTPEEFKERMNKYKSSGKPKQLGSVFVEPNVEVPASVDWREKGAVTPVKDQGQCGSCWAFSTTGSLEGQHFLKTGKLVSLSEQNLVDCAGRYGNAGCGGGLMDSAFEFIKANGGIDTEASYPYEALNGRCRFKKSNVGATLNSFVDIPQGDEEALKKAIATVGPISVAIDAGESSFQFYSGGVYYEKKCSPYNLDHGVLAVGYGTENGQDYWLVKNSWNSKWGENGYIKMVRNKNNNCGIASEASYPVV
uniref:Cathepsin L1 n=1 Tax=Dysdercus peruvianus TaxID=685034 RepID=A0A7U3RXU0_9HEMI|nr:cathepsin L1 [Dysdercus peruvianus]